MNDRKYLETIIKTQLAMSEAKTVDRLDIPDEEKTARKHAIAQRLQKEVANIYEELAQGYPGNPRPGGYH